MSQKKKDFSFKVTDKRSMSADPGTKVVTGEGIIPAETEDSKFVEIKKADEDPEIAALSRFLFETENINPGPMRISIVPVDKEKMMVMQRNGIITAPMPTQGIVAKVLAINKFATKAIESGLEPGDYVICSTQVGTHVHTSDGEVWTVYELDILNIFKKYRKDEQEAEKH